MEAPVKSAAGNRAAVSLKIFPNPASGNVTISFPYDENTKLDIYDMLGRKISTLNGLDKINFNTANLANGIYTVALTGVKNGTQKLVVHH